MRRFALVALGLGLALAPARAQGPVCSVRSVPFVAPGGDAVCGALDPGAPVEGQTPSDGTLTFVLKAWRPQGGRTVLYAVAGLRIRVAVLKDCGRARVKVVERKEDPETGIVWERVEAGPFAAPKSAFAADLTPLWKRAAATYAKACSACHALHAPQEYTANQWPAILRSMLKRTRLREDAAAWVARYLQYHAKDAKNRGLSPPCSQAP